MLKWSSPPPPPPPARCKVIRYRERDRSKPVVGNDKTCPVSYNVSGQPLFNFPMFYCGEGEFEEDNKSLSNQKNALDEFREWITKQRFIPQDLSNEFLTVFLSGCAFDVQLAENKLHKYFYARQEPSPLFRRRDPLDPNNVRILENLYVIPMPDSTKTGEKVIITGLLKETTTYNPLDHAKMLAMVIDLMIWEKDFGFGDFIIVLDGRGFQCPQLLEKKVDNHSSITNLILDTIPGTLRSFYLLYPPPHLANVGNLRNGIWITVVKNKYQMIKHLSPDILPCEYGGNLGCIKDLSEQWQEHLAQGQDFFIHFENKMINDYRRRLCHEKEVREGGKCWVSKMKLEADEWEYKTLYYERMKMMRPLEHPSFGKYRLEKSSKKLPKAPVVDYLKNLKQLKRKLEETSIDGLPSARIAYELRRAKLEEAQTEEASKKFEGIYQSSKPVLHIQIRNYTVQ